MLTILKKIRRNFLVWSTHSLALPVIRRIIHLPRFPFTFHQLAAMPETSLGRELVNFLQAHNLNMLKYYETHDIKHLLLGYPPDEKGEVSLQFFMLGNRHYSPAVLLTVVTGLFTMPEYYRAFYHAWKRGRNTPPIEHTNWNTLITQPVPVLRKQLFIPEH